MLITCNLPLTEELRQITLIEVKMDSYGVSFTATKAAGASSLRAIASEFNARGIVTAQGKARSAMQVKRVLERV